MFEVLAEIIEFITGSCGRTKRNPKILLRKKLMSELLSKVAEILKAPEELVQRSAEARAEASGKSVDEVLQSWAGGEAIESSPAAETLLKKHQLRKLLKKLLLKRL